jgi:hypothetical protein
MQIMTQCQQTNPRITTYPPFLIAPASHGMTAEAPASALSIWKSCSSSDMVQSCLDRSWVFSTINARWHPTVTTRCRESALFVVHTPKSSGLEKNESPPVLSHACTLWAIVQIPRPLRMPSSCVTQTGGGGTIGYL